MKKSYIFLFSLVILSLSFSSAVLIGGDQNGISVRTVNSNVYYVNGSNINATSIICSGTDKISAYNNATGVFTCTVDSGGAGSSDGNNYTDGIFISGGSTKNITLSRQGMGNISATFTDNTGSEIDPFWTANYSAFLLLASSSYVDLQNTSQNNYIIDVNTSQTNYNNAQNTSNNNYLISYVLLQNNSIINWVNSLLTSYYTKTEVDNQNTSQNNYIALNNNSINNYILYVNSTNGAGGGSYNDAWINQTIYNKSIVDTNLTNLNTSNNNYIVDYVTIQNTSQNNYIAVVNTSMKNYVDGQDSSYNTSNNNYILANNNSVVNGLTAQDNTYNTSNNNYLTANNNSVNNNIVQSIMIINQTQNNSRAVDNTSNNNYIIDYGATINATQNNSRLVDNTSTNNYIVVVNTSMKNYIDSSSFISNATRNKTTWCGDILGGPDIDFCTDATGGGAGGFVTDQPNNLNTTTPPTHNQININLSGNGDAIKFNNVFDNNWTQSIEDSGDSMKFKSETGSVLIKMLLSADQVQIKNLYGFSSYTGASAGIFKCVIGQTADILTVKNNTDETLWSVNGTGTMNATRGIILGNVYRTLWGYSVSESEANYTAINNSQTNYDNAQNTSINNYITFNNNSVMNNVNGTYRALTNRTYDNATIGMILSLSVSIAGTLPNNGTAGFSGATYNGTAIRNSTGVWGGQQNGRWKLIF